MDASWIWVAYAGLIVANTVTFAAPFYVVKRWRKRGLNTGGWAVFMIGNIVPLTVALLLASQRELSSGDVIFMCFMGLIFSARCAMELGGLVAGLADLCAKHEEIHSQIIAEGQLSSRAGEPCSPTRRKEVREGREERAARF